MSLSSERDLAGLLAAPLSGAPDVAGSSGDGPGIIRLGTVTDVFTINDGGATYTRVEINDQHEMRCHFTYTVPVVGDVVVWLHDGRAMFCLGPRL